METQLLDVRLIEPRLKHPSIFKNFDNLRNGEVLTLVNDHDPLPLYHQFKAERPGQFDWEYIERGPLRWRVNITRHLVPDQTLGQLVAANPAAAGVFKKLNIDYCCKGNRSFKEVCREAGLDPEEVTRQISGAVPEKTGATRFTEWPLDFLADYIVQNHHRYLRTNIPQLLELTQKVAEHHGLEHPELEAVAETFHAIARELIMHLRKEEEILFPAVRELVKEAATWPPATYCFDTLRDPIRVMELEHSGAGESMEQIRRLTHSYALPAKACYSFKLLYQQLAAFEEDLHQHVHLENNILFPGAIRLEAQLREGR
jgi:regulator of cell morphogenesis and NO signaling